MKNLITRRGAIGGIIKCACMPFVLLESKAQSLLYGAKRSGFNEGLTASGGGSAWTLVHKTLGAGAGSALTLTVPSTTSPNLIVVAVTMSPQTETLSGITDNASGGTNTYSHAGSNYRATDSTSAWSLEVWYSLSTHSGATVITPAGSSAIFDIFAWEVSGIVTGFDVSAALSNQATNANPTGASVTTGAVGDFIVGVCAPDHSITGQFAGNEFTFEGVDSTNGVGFSHITSTSATAASHTPQWVQSATGTFCAVTAAWKV